MTYAQTLVPKKVDTRLRSVLSVLCLSCLFTLSAWISVRFAYTPVPISFTFHLILMASIFFGKRGTYATLLYVAQGVMGLPVFANGGAGVAYLLGPTGGYIVGWVIASCVLATLSDRLGERSATKNLGLMMVGSFIVYLFGTSHLALVLGWQKALTVGLYPFIGSDVIKTTLALKGLKLLEKRALR